MFDRIHARLKSDVDADKKIIKRIRDGEMLGDDPRFAKIREHGDGAHVEMGQLALTDADGAWYRDTRFGKFLQIESELLPKLRDEVKHSVEERRRGLDTIFPPES
jgi:hypothetical protein